MAYGTISNEWLNRNNLETLWAAIVRDFVHAGASPVSGGDGGTTKGSMLYWGQTSTPTGTGQPIQPSHLQIGSTGQLLGVSEGIPEWTTPQLQQAGGVGSTPLTLFLKNASSVALSLQTAGASQWGIITDQAQTLGGEKTFNETIKGKKNIEADWGVAAEGIADLSLSSGGGGGTVTRLILCGTQYDPTSGVIIVPTASLQSDLGLGSAAYKNVGVVASGNSGLVTGDAVSSAINDALTAAMKIEGETTTNVKDNPSANPVVIDGHPVTAYKGMVVFYNSKEFVWTGSSWKELGDESSFALKTTTITGAGYLTGGGSLAESRTLDIADTVKCKINTAYSHATDSGRLTTAQTSGLYKFSVTSEGHIGSVTAMTENDITGLISNTLGTITSSIGQVYAIAQDNSENITLHDGRIADLESYFDGNVALYAERFSSARTISLTGHVTGSASSDGLSGWSIALTISNNVIENGMIKDNTIQNAKLVNKGVTINGTYAALGESKTTEYWGAARNIQITDADDTNEGVATSVNGSQNYKFALPANLKVGTLLSTEGITSNKNIQAHWGVSAQGICDLSLSSGGGGGTIIGVYVNGQTYTSVNAGILTLPDYPTVEGMIEDGLASEEWVQQQITNLSLGTASTHAHTDYVTDITWDSTNRKLKQSKGGGTATDIVQFGTVYSHGHNEYLTDLGVSGDTLTWSKGGTAQDAITVPYATTALDAKTELKQDQTITYRQTGGGTLTKPYSSGVIKRVLGNSVVWNQLLKARVTTSTFTIINDCTISFSFSGAQQFYNQVSEHFYTISGHKYYYHIKQIGSSVLRTVVAGDIGYLTQAQMSNGVSTIINGTGVETFVHLTNDTNASGSGTITFAFVDLTLFFNGNIPEGLTAETFERDYGYLLANPEYNAGTLINNACSGLETVGFNIWDEEWETGWIDPSTGLPYPSNDYIRSKNYTLVQPSTTYYWRGGRTYKRIYYYDTNKNFISYLNGLSNQTFDTPSNCRYIKITDDGGVYNHDICINKSDTSFNGTYEPYKKIVSPLHLNSFRVKDAQGNISTINGLKKAGSVYDEIVGKRFIQRLGVVNNLAGMGWNTADYGYYSWDLYSYGGAKKSGAIICVNPTSYSLRIRGDGAFVAVGSGLTLTEFKSALLNKELYYELATPIEYEIIDDFPTSYPIDVLGTERIVSDELVAPFIGDIQYGAEQRDIAYDINNVFTGLTSRIDAMDISHYQSGQTSPVDSHLITINGKKFYVRFSAVNGGGSSSGSLPSFELAMADNPNGENEQVFSFGTITEQWILDNCKLS